MPHGQGSFLTWIWLPQLGHTRNKKYLEFQLLLITQTMPHKDFNVGFVSKTGPCGRRNIFIGIPLCTLPCRISLVSVDIHIAKWTAHKISLCGHETVRLALKSW